MNFPLFMKIVVPEWPAEASLIKLRLNQAIPANSLVRAVESGERYGVEIAAGTEFFMAKVENPWGHDNPFWLVDEIYAGAADNWWKDLVEMGKAEVLIYIW